MNMKAGWDTAGTADVTWPRGLFHSIWQCAQQEEPGEEEEEVGMFIVMVTVFPNEGSLLYRKQLNMDVTMGNGEWMLISALLLCIAFACATKPPLPLSTSLLAFLAFPPCPTGEGSEWAAVRVLGCWPESAHHRTLLGQHLILATDLPSIGPLNESQFRMLPKAGKNDFSRPTHLSTERKIFQPSTKLWFREQM